MEWVLGNWPQIIGVLYGIVCGLTYFGAEAMSATGKDFLSYFFAIVAGAFFAIIGIITMTGAGLGGIVILIFLWIIFTTFVMVLS